MRLVFAGTPDVALPSLDRLLAHADHEVVAVVTRPDAPAGRGRELRSSPVRRRADEAGVAVLTPAKAGDPEFLAQLRELAPDCCPVVAYGALLPPVALDVPRHGWVNLHFSLLPAWRGAAPVQHAIRAGDEVTGASTFRIEEGLDTGPVFGRLTTDIGPRETAGQLLDRLAVDGAGLLVATLDGIAADRLTPAPQPADGVSHAPRLRTEDARVAWTAPALGVDRQIRACTPHPGPWTTFRGRRLGLGPAVPAPDAEPLAPGEVRDLGPGGVLVGTATDPVALDEVRPEGKAAMPCTAWARGARLVPGERFG